MAPTGYVKATWVGPFEGELPGGRVLVPGESVADVPAGEAEASENWQVVEGAKNAGSAPAVASKSAGTTEGAES